MSGGLSQWWVSVSSLGVCHLSQASAQVLRSSCQLLNLNQQVLLGNCVPEVMPPPLLLLRLGPPMLLLVLNRPMTLARAPATEEVRATGTVEDALRTQHNTHAAATGDQPATRVLLLPYGVRRGGRYGHGMQRLLLRLATSCTGSTSATVWGCVWLGCSLTLAVSLQVLLPDHQHRQPA